MTLDQVLWIGGASGAGKTTIASLLARRHGLRLYSADTRTWEHRDRALRAGNPAALHWEALAPDERWTGPPEELLAMSLHRERATMIVDDLRGLPPSPLIVAEGTPVSPEVVSSGLARRSRAVWLLPTPELLRARLEQRELRPGACRLYLALAATIEREVAEHAAPSVTVDGTRGIEEMTELVEGLFADSLAAGPRAETAAERRALLRETNAAVVNQVRGYYARPWAEGDAEAVVRTYLCECGEPGCTATVELAVGRAAAAPVLASAH